MNNLPWSNPDYFGETAETEKKRFRRDVNRTTLSLVIMLAGANVLAILIVVGICLSVAFMPGAAEMDWTIESFLSLIEMSPTVFNFITAYLPTLVSEVLLIVMLRFWCGFRLRETRLVSSKTEHPWVMSVLGFLGGWGCAALAAVMLTIFLQLLDLLGLSMGMPEITVPMPQEDGWGFAFSMGYVCVVGPVLEEVIFRGYILNGMKKYGEWTGIITSALLFTMFHGNLVQCVTPLLLGLLFAFLTIRTGSLIPSIICHILHNGMQIGMGFLPTGWADLAFGVYAIIGIGALIYFIYKYRGECKRLEVYGRTKKGERIAEWMLTPGFIVFFIVYLLMCALYFIL